MSVTSTNLIQGPAVVWWAPFGTAEPATIATVPGAGWIDVGGTKDGLELTIADTYTVLEVDQIVYEIARRRTARVITAKTTLAEATLDNIARAINNTAPVANKLNLDDGVTAFSPAYGSILVDGIAPGGFKRRVKIRKTLATDSVGIAYKKADQTVVPVTWSAHWVSASILPIDWEDATS
jgi:hypothetical protein